MESRTFSIMPVRRDADIEVIGILDNHLLKANPRAGYKYEYEDTDEDDALVVVALNSSFISFTHNRSIRESSSGRGNRNTSHSIDTIDVRDDEPLSRMVLRSCIGKEQYSPRERQHQLQQQKHRKTPFGGRISTETEKRIAQLRNAGLAISTKGNNGLPPLSSQRIAAQGFRSYKEEEREPPPPLPMVGFDPILKDFRCQGSSSKNSTIQTLLEKDLKLHKQGKAPLSPQPPPLVRNLDPILETRRYHGTRGSVVPKSPLSKTAFDRIEQDDVVDPIIVARPAYRGLRVSHKEYPDPEIFGWTFVGSCGESRIEFFEKEFGNEKGVVVLEFHYTNGTVKTSLKHPIGGESFLAFALGGSRVSPRGLSHKIYRKILLYPLGCSSGGGASSLSSEDSSPS